MAIVVGFVPTAQGRAALRAAAAEAEKQNLPLSVVNSNEGRSHWDPEQAEQLKTEFEAIEERLEAAGIRPSMRILARGNEPVEDIIAVAEEVDASLIVIGLRRRSPVGKLLLGSNAQRLLLEADCPVLAVKAD